MNHVTARCGHQVPAVGAPNSPARKDCENTGCNDCKAKARKVVYGESGAALGVSHETVRQEALMTLGFSPTLR